jgi:glutaminyl-peptide cyclotransferase
VPFDYAQGKRRAYGVLTAVLMLSACVGADAQKPPRTPDAPAASAGQFDSNRAWEHLRRQVALGPRPAGSSAIAETRKYILGQLRAAGVEGREQPFDATTPIGPIKMANIVARIPGARPERIALATHYDTKLYREFRFVGASDGASSTAAVLELARILNQRKNPFTIELIFFDGEEAVNREWNDPDNTYGSRHYVQAGQKDGSLAGLKALILLDLVGDRELNIRRDANSSEWLVDLVWETAARIGHGRYFLQEETAITDDHQHFVRAGVPSIDIIDLDYRAWHTANDTLDAVSARSLQIVGDVVLASLPAIEKRLAAK